jgi:hypothetical protein
MQLPLEMLETTKPVIPLDKPLHLSSAALQTYATCPRQFYYQHLLKLPSPSFDSAEWGRLWHGIMEIFHTQPNPTPNMLKTLVAEVCRQTPRTEDRWPQKVLAWVDGLPPLHQRDVYHKLQRVLDNLLIDDSLLVLASTHRGDQVECTLTYHLKEVNTTFRLRLDLAYLSADGLWHIVDYKTYGSSKFTSKRTETLVQHLTHGLDSFPQRDTTAPHREQYPYPGSKPLIHQLPLYWLAAEQNGLDLNGFSLLILRPQDQGGCLPVTADKTTVDARLPVFAEALVQWIQQDVRTARHFLPEPDGQPCGLCAFTTLCPQALDDPANRGIGL